jgi:ABC-type dipeptide/oligopeptide/nickel transport system ATPase subunit
LQPQIPLERLFVRQSLKFRAARREFGALARQVGLPVDLLDRLPHQLSGGRQAASGCGPPSDVRVADVE